MQATMDATESMRVPSQSKTRRWKLAAGTV
jgi:hypothetical protein